MDRLTSTMEVMGSRWYCAPELRDGRLEENGSQAPADVYSLAKVLFWMLSSKQMFDREEHRSDRYRLGRSDESNQAYELLNELFDRTIVAEKSKRIQNAGSLLDEVDELIEVIEHDGHAASIYVPHRCLFCAQGHYGILENTLDGGRAKEAISQLGWNVPQPSPRWLIMVCDQCGNIQTFRPDLPANRPSGFSLQKVSERVKRWVTKRNL